MKCSSGGVFFLFAYSAISVARQNEHITKAWGVGKIFLAIKRFVFTFIGGWTQINGRWCVCITGASPSCEFGGVYNISLFILRCWWVTPILFSTEALYWVYIVDYSISRIFFYFLQRGTWVIFNCYCTLLIKLKDYSSKNILYNNMVQIINT